MPLATSIPDNPVGWREHKPYNVPTMEYHSPFHYKLDVAAQRSLLEAIQAVDLRELHRSGCMGRLALRPESAILANDTCEVAPCRTRVPGLRGFTDGVGLCLRIPDEQYENSFKLSRIILVGTVGYNEPEAFEPFEDQDSILLDNMVTGLEQARDTYHVLPMLSLDCTSIYG
jgi:hypothetical protein